MGTGDQNKMKIKINGEEKDFKKEEVKESNEPLVVHDWRTKREIAAAEEKATKMKSSIDIIKKKQKRRIFPNQNRKYRQAGTGKFSPTIIVISSISAILIGVIIGIILLNLMMKNPEQNNPSNTNQASTSATATVSGSEEVVLPVVDLFILQQGVYNQEDSVKQIESDFNQKGLPFAYINDNGTFRVFVAVSDRIETGKLLKESSLFSTNFGDTWPTAIKMNEKIIQNVSADEKMFLESAYSFYEKLVKESNLAFIQGEAYSASSEFMKEDVEKITTLNIQHGPIKELQQSLLHAHQAVSTYFESKNNEQWLETQKYLLEFVSKYYLI